MIITNPFQTISASKDEKIFLLVGTSETADGTPFVTPIQTASDFNGYGLTLAQYDGMAVGDAVDNKDGRIVVRVQ